jgi:hypothetical protein
VAVAGGFGAAAVGPRRGYFRCPKSSLGNLRTVARDLGVEAGPDDG